MLKHKALAFGLLAGILCAGGTGLAAEDVVKVRQDGFKANKESMEFIKKALEGGSTTGIAAEAEKLNAFAKKVPSLFPPGSTTGKTEAKAEIWQDFAAFTKAAELVDAETAKLVQVAAGGDAKAIGAQFKTVAGACKACHEKFRQE